MVQPVPEQSIKQQETSFAALLQSLGQASFSEIEQIMAERDEVEPEPSLTPDIVQRLQERIAEKQQIKR